MVVKLCVVVVKIIKIKICGITNSEDASYAVKFGADALGFIFFPGSPRFIEFTDARAIVSSIPPFVSKIGLFVNPSHDIVENCIKNVGIDTLQFHGNESSEFCSVFGLPWIKTISVDATTDIRKKVAQYENASAYLFDTKKPDSFGGTGQVFDWNLIPKDLTKPIILAGGLGIENIEDAIKIPELYAVDVCSGVEQEKGKKSKTLMNDFIEKVRRIN